MRDDVLYQRTMAHGPAVRIRRTSDTGTTPVIAVLEVERRAGTPREGQGTPPALLHCEAASERDALSMLESQAGDDRLITRLLHSKGLR
jgi:hypothetical protein